MRSTIDIASLAEERFGDFIRTSVNPLALRLLSQVIVKRKSGLYSGTNQKSYILMKSVASKIYECNFRTFSATACSTL